MADASWKQIAEPVMKLYTETTDGSTIEDKETSLVWSYEDADPDFGSCQAKELLDHLESVLANEPVSVKRGQTIVEVKPQVCNSTSLPVDLMIKIVITIVGIEPTDCSEKINTYTTHTHLHCSPKSHEESEFCSALN